MEYQQNNNKLPRQIKTETISPPKKEIEESGDGVTDENDGASGEENVEQMAQLLAQLRESKTQASRDQRRITELEEQLVTMVQQNQALENQVMQMHHRDDEDMKSMYDELSTLEEVRYVREILT